MRCVGCREEVCCEERCMCDSEESLYAPNLRLEEHCSDGEGAYRCTEQHLHTGAQKNIAVMAKSTIVDVFLQRYL